MGWLIKSEKNWEERKSPQKARNQGIYEHLGSKKEARPSLFRTQHSWLINPKQMCSCSTQQNSWEGESGSNVHPPARGWQTILTSGFGTPTPHPPHPETSDTVWRHSEASMGCHPRDLLNNPQCTGQPPTAKNPPPQIPVVSRLRNPDLDWWSKRNAKGTFP